MPKETKWIVLVNHHKVGPVSKNEVLDMLRKGHLRWNDVAHRVHEGDSGLPEWKFIWQYPPFERRKEGDRRRGDRATAGRRERLSEEEVERQVLERVEKQVLDRVGRPPPTEYHEHSSRNLLSVLGLFLIAIAAVGFWFNRPAKIMETRENFTRAARSMGREPTGEVKKKPAPVAKRVIPKPVSTASKPAKAALPKERVRKPAEEEDSPRRVVPRQVPIYIPKAVKPNGEFDEEEEYLGDGANGDREPQGEEDMVEDEFYPDEPAQ